MTYMEFKSAGVFGERQEFENQSLAIFRELERAEHHAGMRRRPLFKSEARSPSTLPFAGEPGEIREGRSGLESTRKGRRSGRSRG